jgi:2-(1,2-epoxy-1,2-dihydrophenyl)acetyl-CoA isomerase
VNGVAAGGGCNLALSCDIRIASEKARFGEVFTRRGTHPDWGGIYFLPRLVGYAKAAELLFSGEIIDAREALAIGMVNKVVPHEDLMSATYKMAEQIVKSAPIPISFVKRGLQSFYRMDLRQALDYEAYALEVCRRSDDFGEGFTSFLEKRDPVFKGR